MTKVQILSKVKKYENYDLLWFIDNYLQTTSIHELTSDYILQKAIYILTEHPSRMFANINIINSCFTLCTTDPSSLKSLFITVAWPTVKSIGTPEQKEILCRIAQQMNEVELYDSNIKLSITVPSNLIVN